MRNACVRGRAVLLTLNISDIKCVESHVTWINKYLLARHDIRMDIPAEV